MRIRSMGWVAGCAAFLIFPSAAPAQMAPSARKPDAAPSIPDFSGIWQKSGGGPGLTEGEPPMTPWGREKYAAAKPIHGPRIVSPTESNAAELQCLPMGIPGTYFRPRTMEIVQLPDRAIMIFEVDHMWRNIHLDGRTFPEVALDSWMGYSIGHYEGDTLVVETRQFRGWEENAQRWLDRLGHPFSDELRVTERFRRINQNSLQNQITIEDPKAYTEPWTANINFRLMPDFEMGEFVCQELMLSDLPEMRPGQ
jgi:hypothetical protein